jgi:hypothetical protein
MTRKKLRLLFYIKHPDKFITKGIGRVQNYLGIHDSVWQIIHTVHLNKCIHIDELKSIMTPYADHSTVNNILTKLRIQCIIFNAEDKITLTSNGVDFYKSCFAGI